MNKEFTKQIIESDKENREKGKVTLNFNEQVEIINLIKEMKNKKIFSPGNKPDKREILCFNFIFDLLLPRLHQIAEKESPEIYNLYQGNLCRQSALFSMFFLLKFMPDWEWTLCEVSYRELFYNQTMEAEHAFIYGKKGKEKRVIDMWDKMIPKFWVRVKTFEYPKFIEGNENIEILELKKLPYSNIIKNNVDLLGESKKIAAMLEKEFSNIKIK